MRDEFDDDLDDEPTDGDDEALEMLDCPKCGRSVYEEAEQCPHCGEYIAQSSSVLHGRPWWFVLLALAGIAAVIFTIAAGF